MKKKAIIVLGVLVLLGTITFTSYSYVKVKQWSSLILPKVKIGNEDLTGKTKEEAQDIIKDKYSSQIIKKKINIVAGDKKYSLDYSKLDAKYNINEALEEAVSYGKDMNMFEKYKAIKNPVQRQIELKFEYNDKYIDQTIEQIVKDTNKKAVDATITMVSSGVFNVTNDVVGKQLEVEKLKADIKSKINGSLSEATVSIEAAIQEVKPKVTAATLNTIDKRISSFSTNFESSAEGRAINIGLSTKSINGTLLMPGDVFSFNGIVGERTQQRGYQSAGVIVGDKLEQGLGGGICQVSSTLYNAILGTDIISVERTHHTFPSGYIPIGQDATVDYGNLDYKFKNNYTYPIFIEGYVSNRNLYFNIYSNSALAKKTYTVSNEILESIEPKTEKIPDPTKYEGEIEIVQKAYTGYKVRVTRKTFENGVLINTQVINNDTYKVINGIIKEGTKKKETLAPVPNVPAVQ
ncbi:VanW family protein [Clostridium sp. CS001]|uniref:VanW family protein n=1 Tax=Clostridium sp. CS001 TaxID=2880648 RepID=UPI001CF39B8B|nr:VanW family protein [Clostridium sp. CS001]MCB2290451.1 VanW family protein [Clostridium sp. CS001]